MTPADSGGQALPPPVTGQPLRWLRADGLALFAAALLLFAGTHESWWLVPAAILLPDLSMAGYLRGDRAGATAYNLAHSYPLPALACLAGTVGHSRLALALGLVWLAHVGADRAAGFGLKYETGFRHTHLGTLARGVHTHRGSGHRARP